MSCFYPDFLDRIGKNLFCYTGKNQYIITQDDDGSFTVSVEALDEDGEPVDAGYYQCDRFSGAIEIIEDIENGKQV